MRPGEQPPLFWGGKLLQQYVVDAWAFVKQSTLDWIKHHQRELRADVYQSLRDANEGDRDENLNLRNHGTHVILLLSHIGGEWHMMQLF
jgi:hypothetical protein